MAKRMIVRQPPPPPTPVFGTEVKDMVRKRLKVVEAIGTIPGVTAFQIGDGIKIRITGNSFGDIAQKIAQLPEEIKWAPSKTMCDGEPVRIT